MTEEKRLSKRQLKELKENNPKGFDDKISYGIIPKQPRPEDTLYLLEYDPEKRYLKINGFVIRHFQFDSNAEIYFSKLFKKKGWVKTVAVKHPARAGVVVNNTRIPIELRNAIFDIGHNETKLVAHTVIRRGRARNFGVNDKEIQKYILECREKHYSLLDTGKRK